MSNRLIITNFNKSIFFITAVFIMIAISLVGFNTTSLAKSTYNLQVEAEVAYDRTVKIGSGNAILINLTNTGEDFKGNIEINVDSSPENKLVFAQKIEISSGSKKQIVMNFTLYTIQKDFTINIVKDKKIHASTECKATKVLPPDALVIGIVSDNQDSYNFMAGFQAPSFFDYEKKMVTNQISKTSIAESQQNTVQANVISLDGFEDFKSVNELDYFDIILIGKKKGLNISDTQERIINKWIEMGNTLAIFTGENYKSIYSTIPESLKPYAVTGVNEYYLTQDEIYPISTLTKPVMLTNGITKELRTIYSNNEVPLALYKSMGLGGIVTLTFNTEIEPIRSWQGKLELMQSILNAAPTNKNLYQYNEYYMPSYYHQFGYLTNNVPTEKKPPYQFMLYVFIVYILLIGPGLYFILKKADKRDFNWILIPVVSLTCILLLYIFGFNTRYNKPVLNAVSIINIETEEDLMSIETDMAMFNNRKGKLTLSWPSDSQLLVDYVSDNQRNYYEEEIEDKKVIGRITNGTENIYEIYNTGLWDSRKLTSSKVVPINISPDIISINLYEDGRLKGKVVNNTPLNLQHAFISIGKYYIFIGDLMSGQEKSFDASYVDSSLRNFETFFDIYYRSQNNTSKQYNNYNSEIERIRDLYSTTIYGRNNILDGLMLVGINKDQIDYGIMANKNIPETYSTNVVMINQEMKFESGKNIVIPAGAIEPNINFMREDGLNSGDYHYDRYNDSIYAYENGYFEFEWELPVNTLKVTGINIQFGDIYRYNNNQNTDIKYYIFNNNSEEWDEITKESKLQGELLENYISNEGILKSKQELNDNNKNHNENRVGYPALLIEGVAK